MRASSLFFCLAVATASACSLFTDLSGYSDASRATGEDAAASPAEGGAEDGGAGEDDASVPDALVPSFGCGVPHAFCDGFEGGEDDLSKRWDTFKTESGPLDLDRSAPFAGARALRAVLASGVASRESYIGKLFTLTSQTPVIGFRMDLEAPGSSDFGEVAYADLILIPSPTGYLQHGVTIVRHPPGVRFEYWRKKAEDEYEVVNVPVSAPNGWHAYEIVVDRGPSPGATLRIDGAEAASLSVTGETTEIELRLGLPFTSNATTTNTVRFDDVWYDAR